MLTVTLRAETAWPAPTVLRPSRRAEAQQQQTPKLFVDLPAPSSPLQTADSSADTHEQWPQPARRPQGPPVTVLADELRLANLLAEEEKRHLAHMRRMRAEWAEREAADRREAMTGGEALTLVERRRLVSHRARRLRREREEAEARARAPPPIDSAVQTEVMSAPRPGIPSTCTWSSTCTCTRARTCTCPCSMFHVPCPCMPVREPHAHPSPSDR